ncbi:MAG: ABC transporter permease [Planctomycetaceae bacterium]|nr:ABC transporter permease [Planctomycetaceae bacterium]
MDRRGQLRTRFVIRFDTEAKNSLTTLRGAELLSGQYRYGVYRITSHFLTATFLYLLLAVAALALMASGQASITDTKLPVKGLFLPTITVDDLVMRFTEIMMTIPVIFLILAILAIFEKDVFITMGVIGLTSWMGTTRFVRAEILSLREQDFVQAARALGAGGARIMFRELLPNAIAPVLVAATLKVATAVLMESYISYLGYGIQPPLASWGNMLNNAQSYFGSAPWVAIFPGVMITLAVTSFNFLGDGLRDAFDPRHVTARR